MHWKSLFRRALPVALVGAWLPATASADEITHTVVIPPMTTAFIATADLPQFDPADGVLTGIRVGMTTGLDATLQFESNDSQSSTITVTLDVGVELRRPDMSTLIMSALQASVSDTVAPADGNNGNGPLMPDFMGPSGRTFPGLMDSDSQSLDLIPPSAADEAAFTGLGVISLPVLADGVCNSMGSANVIISCMNDAGATVTVTYFFQADCQPNGVPDDEDIEVGTSQDCQPNGIPDECEPDCDSDGIPDDCEPDCNFNGIPDDCDELPCPDCVDISRRTPGSLLLYPEFDNRVGMVTLVTVTNVNPDKALRVHFIYIGRFGPKHTDLDCLEFDRTENLTPNETLTVFTSQHNPQQEQGFLYVYVVDQFGTAVACDSLIGHILKVDGLELFEYEFNPVDFRAGAGLSEGDATDLDFDGVRDLNGQEYEETADEILVPRFLGQKFPGDDDPFDPNGDLGRMREIHSRLILVSLSGGSAFTTTAAFSIYNDDEDAFSAQHTFRCWDKPYLTDVSFAFLNSFLTYATSHNPDKGLGNLEYGWFRMRGQVASSTFFDILDPAVYGVLIEVLGGIAAADLPFELCTQDGHLFPRLLSGDNEE